MARITFSVAGGRPRPASIVGKIAATLFLSLFLGLGGWFTVLLARVFLGYAQMYTWPPSECLVEASGVEEHPEAAEATAAYVFQVRYRYTVDGRELSSTRYHPTYSGSSDLGDARQLADAYPVGSRVECWVNPKDPSSATLRRPGLWGAFFLLLPLVFVAFGAGGIFAIWKPERVPAPGMSDLPQAISRKDSSTIGGTGCIVAFLSLFVLVGLGLGVFFARPALEVLAARSWREVPCTILHSQVRTHSGDDSNTYSVAVLYTYAVDGREYKSSRYQFLGGSTSGRESKEEAVRRLPPGARTVCYVDPADPSQAVIQRGFSAEYLVGLVPLVFILAGGGAIVGVLRVARRKRAGGPRWLPAGGTPIAPVASAGASALALPPRGSAGSGPVQLETSASPLGKFVVICFVALFWNGIVSLFLWQVVSGWRAGAGDGCATAFLVPFVLIGLLLLSSVPYQFLALFNPRPRLTLDRGEVPLGGSVRLDWRFSGAAGRIRRLRIVIEGVEEAVYRRGTSTYTDRETFATIPVIDTDQASMMPAGSATISIPADSMHSFSADHNKVLWKLKVSGEIRRWPDVEEELELLVAPGEGKGVWT